MNQVMLHVGHVMRSWYYGSITHMLSHVQKWNITRQDPSKCPNKARGAPVI